MRKSTSLKVRKSPSVLEQLQLGHLYNSEHGIHLGDKLWKKQYCSSLHMYKKLCAKSGAILEGILEWDGSFDEFSNETSACLPFFLSNSLETIEKELIHSAKNHYFMKRHRYTIKLVGQSASSDISVLQNVQSYSPECNITFQKYTAMKMDEFLDLYP